MLASSPCTRLPARQLPGSSCPPPGLGSPLRLQTSTHTGLHPTPIWPTRGHLPSSVFCLTYHCVPSTCNSQCPAHNRCSNTDHTHTPPATHPPPPSCRHPHLTSEWSVFLQPSLGFQSKHHLQRLNRLRLQTCSSPQEFQCVDSTSERKVAEELKEQNCNRRW